MDNVLCILYCFCSTKLRADHAAREVKLPDTSDIDTHNPFVPPMLVVQIQIPSDPPPMFGAVEDGPGWAILMYFKITEVCIDSTSFGVIVLIVFSYNCF